jgi:hypothetical protein
MSEATGGEATMDAAVDGVGGAAPASSPAMHFSLPALWGLLGITALVGSALYRLTPRAVEAVQSELTTVQWVVLAVWLLFMGYSEGYKGFQKAFAPRVAARAFVIHSRPLLSKIFAPFFCMGLMDATRKRKIVSRIIVGVIVVLVVSVRYLDQPWRGIVDAGVVLGLGWGLVAVWVMVGKAAAGTLDTNPELPDS